MVNINALVLGVAQGGINYYLLMQKYPKIKKADHFEDHL
jgi:hypothetical protein